MNSSLKNIYYKLSPFGMLHFPKNQQEESQNQPLYLQEILGFSTALDLLHESVQAQFQTKLSI